MSTVTIYHNPRCSKSCQTLQLLESKGIKPEIVFYLQNPPDAQTLRNIIKMLGVDAQDRIRKKETLFTTLGLNQKNDDDEALIQAMVQHPTLIERPIVVNGNKAALGRPPDSVLQIL